ncbi:MAG: SDR family NAD(P)-dependent oxidoreductase [Opitutales bacterium]
MPWSSTLQSFGAVVITGGSSGIGAAFIRTIQTIDSAPGVINLSRTEIGKNETKTPISHIPTDLGDPEAIRTSGDALISRLAEMGDGPLLLINNAGFGHYGAFSSPGAEDAELGMIEVNVRAVVDLTQRLLPLLRARGGAVINIASLAAFQPTPYFATYGASKAFLLHWSLALNEELRRDGVRFLAVCPGPTESNFFRRAGFKESPAVVRGQSAEAVVEEALRALHRGRAQVVTGVRNRFLAFFSARLPKPFAAWLSRHVMVRFRLAAEEKGAFE